MSPFVLVLAAAVTALLFWLMGEEGEPSPVARRALFALMGGAVVVLLVGTRGPAERREAPARGDPARAFRSYAEALVTAKAWFPSQLLQAGDTAGDLRARAIHGYESAIRYAPDSVLFRRQLGILDAFAGDLGPARKQLRRVAEIRRARGEASAGLEARLWARILGDPPPSAKEVPRLRSELQALRLGWFEHLALASLYRRAGQSRQADREVSAARREALIQISLLGIVEIALVGLFFFGFIGGGIFLFLAARGTIRPAPRQFQASPRILWEAFILYMFLYALQALPRLVLPALRLRLERSPTLFILLLFASDALELLAVLYLWAALSRRRLRLAEVGLHARALAADVGFGFAAYAVTFPWIFAIGWLTDWLGQRYFRNLAPPFHPIQALTVETHDWWLRLALFAVAAIGAPFFEELFFRGVFYGALRRRLGIAAGILVSAALFAGLHPQLPLGFLPLFSLGVALAAIYEWRQSLVPGMLFHAIQNTLAFVVLNVLFPPGG